MTRVAISESVLEWALERSGKFAAVERRFPKLSEWLEGQSQPTFRQLEAMARLTSTPLGYFFLQHPPDDQLPIPLFRTYKDDQVLRPSPDLLESFQLMERRQTWVRDYLVEQGAEPLAFVSSTQIGDDPQHIADEIRHTLGLDGHWAAEQSTWTAALREMQRKIEELGLFVVVNGVVGNNTHRPLNPSEFRGFVLVDDYAPFIFVNGADSKAAQMFTLAHELAHVWFGSSAAFDLRDLQPAEDDTEQACNRVAAEFLVPAEELRTYWPSINHQPAPFHKIARRFKVSEIVAARRTLDLNLIAKREFLDFYREYIDRDFRTLRRDEGGGNFYNTQNMRLGRRFAETVVLATWQGRLLYSEAFQLTGLYGKSFDRYAELIGFGGGV